MTIHDGQPNASNAYALGAVSVGPYRNHAYGIRRDIADGDAGGSGAGAGAGAGGGGAAPITLTEDTTFIPPGGKDPVRYGDWIKGYRPAADFTAHEDRYKQGQQFLLTVAQQFDKLLAQQGGGGRGRQATAGAGAGAATQKSITDVMKSLRGEAVIGGEQLVDFMEQFSGTTLEPLMKTVAALVLKNQELEKTVKGIHGSVGKLDGRSVESDHVRRLDTVLGSLKLDPKNEPLRDLADFLYRAHLPGEDLDKEYPTLFKNLVDGLRKYFRTEAQAEAEKARQPKPFRLPQKGGAATPTGQPTYKHQNGRAVAAQLFRGVEAGT